MRTVWAVSEGEYSDYHVLAIFERKEDAEAWQKERGVTETYDESRVQRFPFLAAGEVPQRVNYVQLSAEVLEDGSVREKDPRWTSDWDDFDVPQEGRAWGRTWSAPAYGRGLAISVRARTEDLARKALADRIANAKAMVPIPRDTKINDESAGRAGRPGEDG